MAQKTQFWTKIKKFLERYDLPSQGKFWPAITQQHIELQCYSNPLKTACSLECEKN